LLGGRLGSDPKKIICQSCHTPHGQGILLKPVDDSSLCIMCHQEKGSKAQFLSEARPLHPIGIIPKKDISQAPVFRNGGRLSKSGRLICLSCHSTHDGMNRSMVLDRDLSSFCQNCHSEAVQQISAGKHNLLKTAPGSKNRDNETPRQSGMCRACHRAHGWAQVGPPGLDSVSSLCLGCHQEGKAAPKKTIGPISHPIDVDLPSLREESSLRPLKKGGRKKVVCITCHNPHVDRSYLPDEGIKPKSDQTNNFLRKSRKGLCRECHQDHFTVEGTKHDFRLADVKENSDIKKRVDQWGPCAACHQIHKAKQRYQWALEPSPDIGPGSTMCGGCHSKGNSAPKRPIAPYNHPLGIPCDREITQSLPFLETGLKDKKKIIACFTCHNPHQWSASDKGGDFDKEGSGMNSFLRIPNDAGSGLCINCHNDKNQIKETDHDLRHTDKIEKSAFQQSLEVRPLCSGCHLTHGDDPEKKLWSQGLAGEGMEVDRACLGCHREGRVGEKKPIFSTHYLGPISKDISLDKLSLFIRAKGKKEKYLTCVTCHDPHQWSQSMELKGRDHGNNSEGTGESSFLRVGCQQDAMLCQDCHQGKATIINTEHDLRLFKDKLSVKLLASIQAGGVCSPCHAPHNFSSKRFLWARKTGPGSNDEERICFSCHRRDGIAENKIPKRYSHPDVLVKAALEKTKLSLKEIIGIKGWGTHTYGEGIHCFICHDSHRWSLGQEGAGPGRNLEGNASNSFLWMKSYDQICSFCHQKEGLYRYLYFHRWEGKKAVK